MKFKQYSFAYKIVSEIKICFMKLYSLTLQVPNDLFIIISNKKSISHKETKLKQKTSTNYAFVVTCKQISVCYPAELHSIQAKLTKLSLFEQLVRWQRLLSNGRANL